MVLRPVAECPDQFFDLTDLPLISILSRKSSSLLFLVRAKNNITTSLGSNNLVVVKLFASLPGENASIPERTSNHALLSQQLATITDESQLETKGYRFFREYVGLYRAQDIRQVPRLLGWGVAENYRGIVMEALPGPLLADYTSAKISQPSPHSDQVYRPPPHLHLAYILHWARDMALTLKNIHERGLIHGDVRIENFMFRKSPSIESFGELVIFDFDGSFIMRKPKHSEALNYVPQKLVTNKQFAADEQAWTETLETILGFENEQQSNAIRLPCSHHPIEPPPKGGGSPYIDLAYKTAPEAGRCRSTCPAGCTAERDTVHWAQKLYQETRARLRLVVAPSPPSMDLEVKSRCQCPKCQCHSGSMDVWCLGLVMAKLFGMESTKAHSLLTICPDCGPQVTLSTETIDEWGTHLESAIDWVGLSYTQIACQLLATQGCKREDLIHSELSWAAAHTEWDWQKTPSTQSPQMPPSSGRNSSGEGLWDFKNEDDKRNVLWKNPASEKMVVLTPSDAMQKVLSECITDARREWATRVYPKVRQTLKAVVLQSLKINPSERPSSRDVWNALDELVSLVDGFFRGCSLFQSPMSASATPPPSSSSCRSPKAVHRRLYEKQQPAVPHASANYVSSPKHSISYSFPENSSATVHISRLLLLGGDHYSEDWDPYLFPLVLYDDASGVKPRHGRGRSSTIVNSHSGHSPHMLVDRVPHHSPNLHHCRCQLDCSPKNWRRYESFNVPRDPFGFRSSPRDTLGLAPGASHFTPRNRPFPSSPNRRVNPQLRRTAPSPPVLLPSLRHHKDIMLRYQHFYPHT